MYPRNENGSTYTEDMNAELVEKFSTQIFNQGSAILIKNFIIHQI